MKLLPFIAFTFLGATIALAGEIYGTITEADKPVPAGTRVEVAIAGNTYAGETDQFGSYHIFAKDKGKCTLTVYYKNEAPAATIFSYDKATRYDWTIESVDGKLTLKRK